MKAMSMTRFNSVWGLLSTALLNTALPASASAASKIEEVVVFADRAEITRGRTIDCAQNKGVAIFEHLPQSLDVRTLRPDTRGGEVIGTSSSLVFLEESSDAKVAKLEKALEAQSEKVEALEAEQTLLDAQEGRLGTYSTLVKSVLREEIRAAKPDQRKWGLTLDSFTNKRRAYATKRASLQKKLRVAYAERSKLQKRLLRTGSKRRKRERRAEVTVECGGKARLKVQLAYVVPGARWSPEYDLRFTPRGNEKVGPGRATLTVAAVIQQSTGEDWKGVKLHLSTAAPKLGSEAPYPAALWVNGRKRRDGKVLVQAQEERKTLRRGKQPGVQAAGPLQDKGHSFVLSIPHSVSVVSDGRPYWVPVEVRSAKATSKLLAMPKLSPYVYQVVEMDNPAPYPLLKGRVHSFRKNTFIGDTQLEYHGIGEPMRISLGRDEEIKIQRKTLQRKKRKASTFSWTQHLEQAYEIELTNQARKGQTVYVQESIPVSKIEDVRVELIKKETTAGYKLDKERGFMTWAVKLKRSGSAKVKLGYHIHIPEDWQVPGR